jgi:hypothetical protein
MEGDCIILVEKIMVLGICMQQRYWYKISKIPPPQKKTESLFLVITGFYLESDHLTT